MAGDHRRFAHTATRPLWAEGRAERIARAPLDGDVDVDVAIVGGGFSGLWTAYYLARLAPSARIMIVERDTCGFGASGRNGGWAVGEFAGSIEAYAARSTLDAAIRQEHAIADAVDEIGRVASTEGLDCGFAKGGNIRLARNEPQARRQRDEVAHAHSLGFTDDHIRLLSADEARRQLGATDVRSGIFFAPCAALDPAALVDGLADIVEAQGTVIHENTPVRAIDHRRIVTELGNVRAGVVVRATEAYTRDLHDQRRSLLPVYSLMIATEPLTSDVFDEIGLAERPTFADDRRNVIYGQRTVDDRIAFGSQGALPYRFGSLIDPATELHEPSHAAVHDTLLELLPALTDAAITHRWGGVLAIPRNWLPSVRYDRQSGQAALGGYVGEGVAASNLAGRTLAELITGTETERTSLPWVDLRSRRWEPEPLRWLGVRTSRALFRAADRREDRTGRSDRIAGRIAGLLRGH